MLNLPCRAELYGLCQNVWNADGEFMLLLVHAARELGRQAILDQGDRPEQPTKDECIRLLQCLARFCQEVPATEPAASAPASRNITTENTESTEKNKVGQEESPSMRATSTAFAPGHTAVSMSTSRTAVAPTTTSTSTAATASAPAGENVELTTPVPSAAASVALWELQDPLADLFVMEATVHENVLAGDYVSWQLARGKAAARTWELALRMLPAAGAKERVYFENERAAGAMLLALSARDDAQRKQASERIGSRLDSDQMDFVVKGSYRCGLLLLGQNQWTDDVTLLLETGFPKRRSLTALLGTGDKQAADWLLWNSQLTPEQVAVTLVLRGLQDVLEVVAPTLPRIDPAANYDLRMWQLQILRDSYLIHRANMKMQYKP
jgi:hypothetical protein